MVRMLMIEESVLHSANPLTPGPAQMEDVLLLLRFNCPSPSCAYQAASWDNLEKHTLSVHGAVLCHLCRRQLSRFAHEQVLYPPHLLPLHDPSRVPRGHRAPRLRGEKEEEMVAGWGPPHPMCEVSRFSHKVELCVRPARLTSFRRPWVVLPRGILLVGRAVQAHETQARRVFRLQRDGQAGRLVSRRRVFD